MYPTKLIYKLLALIFIFSQNIVVYAYTRVDINQVKLEPVTVVMPMFGSQQKASESTEFIYKVIRSDLLKTHLFLFVEPPVSFDIKKFDKEKLKQIKETHASAIIMGDIKVLNDSVMFHLAIWDAYSQKKIADENIRIDNKRHRKTAHIIANKIYQTITGDKGYFDSRVTYASIPDSEMRHKRRLAVVDYDGANLEYLTKGDHLIMTPRINKKFDRILYLSYEDPKRPKVKMINMHTKANSVVGVFHGMTYAPRFTSQDDQILMSIIKRGISNIYLYNLKTSETKQITRCNSICTSPSESPDGRQIVFNSDMSGGRNLFTMDQSGKNIKRISFGKGYYTTPVWSPRGDLIAFTKVVPGEGFYIGVMSVDGSNERLIADGWLVEGPSWSPNGRLIMFEKSEKNSISKLHTVDISGQFEDAIKTKTEAVDGNWS